MVSRSLISTFNLSKPHPIGIRVLVYTLCSHLHFVWFSTWTFIVVPSAPWSLPAQKLVSCVRGMDAGPEDGNEDCRQQHQYTRGQGLQPEPIFRLLGLGVGTDMLGARQVDWWDCWAAAVCSWQGSAHSLSAAALLAWLKQWLNPLKFPNKFIVPLSKLK